MRRDDRRRTVTLVLGVLVLIAMISPFILPLLANGAEESEESEPVIVLGTGGLTWDDIDEETTPQIAELAAEGQSANLVVRSVGSTTCRTDGWLGLSAGRRAAAERNDDACVAPAPVPEGTTGAWQVPGWDSYVDAADRARFDAEPGTLGAALAGTDLDAVAFGGGAAVALADPAGAVADARHAPRWDPDLADSVAAAVEEGADLVVVDLDLEGVRGRTPPLGSEPAALSPRQLDDRVEDVLTAVEATGAEPTVLLASLYDATRTSTLQALVLAGTGDAPGLATSGATRTDGLVQAPDLLPTVLGLLDVDPPGGLIGSPLLARPGEDDPAARADGLRDAGLRASAVGPLVSPAVLWLVGLNIGLGAAALVGLNRRVLSALGGTARVRTAVLRVLRGAALVVASLPVALIASGLVPWWRAGSPGLALTGVTLAMAALVALAAGAGPWRHTLVGPVAVVSGATALVIAVDVATGSHLFLGSVLGTQPQIGARYFGMSNHYFALFSTAVLVLVASAAQALVARGRRVLAAVVVLVLGLVATAIDGAPALGADFGGPPAMIPAFVILALLVAGVRVTWPRLLVVGAVTVAAAAALAVADWLRPADERTHLGRFVDTVLDGGALDVIWRKLARNLEILVSSPFTIMAAVGAIVVVVLVARPLRRPETAETSDYGWLVRRPEGEVDGTPVLHSLPEAAVVLRPAAISVLVLWGIGFAVNDSGIVIPALGIALVVPLTLVLLTSWLLARPRLTPDSPEPQPEPEAEAQPESRA